MDPTRNDPWARLEEMRRQMDRAFDRALGPREPGDQSDLVTSNWTPAVDIKEEPHRFVVYADIPGVDPKEIEVTMENGVLTVRGRRALAERAAGAGYTRTERPRGNFCRRFALPDSADPERITARGSLGVLEVSIPRKASTGRRRIRVQA
ncbi:MAG TPA: Hsp20/alpha crystallin family protein [Gammaproteobacteria bacterium]|nr:Hsp20/alpha crystallin family protein [Gammaproteobacteria bacterium]